MRTFFGTTALAAVILALGAFTASPAMAGDKHRHHGWHKGGHGHFHSYRPHRGKKVVVVRPHRRVVHTQRVVVMAAPLPPIYRAAPVAVPVQAPVQHVAYCREYMQNVIIGGVHRTVYGTACQQPDGSWRTVN